MNVYFAQCGDAIKVGVARDVRSRLSGLAVGSASPITLVASVRGDTKLEERIHDRLKKHHVRGEWFRDGPEVRAVIDEIVRTSDVAAPKPRRNLQPPKWAAFAKICWPTKTAVHIAAIAGKDERTAKRWMAGEFEPPQVVALALITKLFERG